jgi:hypothetical protein
MAMVDSGTVPQVIAPHLLKFRRKAGNLFQLDGLTPAAFKPIVHFRAGDSMDTNS